MILWVLGTLFHLSLFLFTVEISWWRYQFKSPPMARLFLEIMIISSFLSLNVVLAVFSQLSQEFHVNPWEWHLLPVSRCNLTCRLFFKSFCELFVDWYTFQFQCFPSWLVFILVSQLLFECIFENESSLLSIFSIS